MNFLLSAFLREEEKEAFTKDLVFLFYSYFVIIDKLNFSEGGGGSV